MLHGINKYIVDEGILKIETLEELNGILMSVIEAIPDKIYTDNVKEELKNIVKSNKNVRHN